MNLPAFKRSLAHRQPPDGLPQAVQALWWDAKGDWDKAHDCAQAESDKTGAWVHAYLHRKEGDHSNARYWYKRAGAPMGLGSLEDEWDAILRALLRPS